MRLFIAINIPTDIKSKIGALVNRNFKTANVDVKWVEEENFHITIKFLGEILEDKIGDIENVLFKVSQGISPFDIRLAKTGVFPDINNVRVVWVGITQGEKELTNIAKTVDEELSILSFPKETRPFSSHITIGRVRSKKNITSLIKRIISNENFEIGSFRAESIDLMQSILNPKGPEYKCLKTFKFSGI